MLEEHCYLKIWKKRKEENQYIVHVKKITKKVLAIYGKILYSIYLSAVRQTPHDDAGHRKASQCFMDFKKEIQKSY